MKKVFLGGTCNDSTWRDALIPLLKIDYFNPVVSDWNEAAQIAEDQAKASCDIMLYVLTPKSNSPYSIAEVVDDSNKRPHRVIFCFVEYNDGQFTGHERKAFTKIGHMIEANGARWCKSLEEVAETINERALAHIEA